MNLPYYEDIKDWGLDKYLQSINKKNIVYKTWKTGKIYNQESPSCVGCAAALLLSSEPNPIAFAKVPDPEFILKEAKKFDETAKTGTSLKSGLKAIQKLGYVKSYYYSDKIDEILVAIMNLGPVIVGVDWYHGMNDCTGQLIAGGGVAGNHAFLIYGVDLEKKQFLLANSFGEGWGWKGKAQVDFVTMNKIFKYGWAIEKNV